MKNKKLIILISSIVLLILGIALINQIARAARTDTDNRSSKVVHSSVTNLSVLVTSTTTAMQQRQTGGPLYFPLPIAPQKNPTAGAKNHQPTPTASSAQPTPKPTPPPNPAVSTPYRYFPVGTSLSDIQSKGKALSKQQVKLLIEKEVDGSWGVIQQDLGFSTKEKAYAFFLGMSTCESTLSVGVETGDGPSHSYGALQAAEPSYADTNAGYAPEDNVPEMTQLPFTPENFYDPGISIYMGMRHLIHFSKLAKEAGYSGVQLLRHELIGYNTGVVTFSDESYIHTYSDEIGSTAGWYLANGHLYDDQFTYRGDPRLDLNQPWGWY
jgi:hypothetical protein